VGETQLQSERDHRAPRDTKKNKTGKEVGASKQSRCNGGAVLTAKVGTREGGQTLSFRGVEGE